MTPRRWLFVSGLAILATALIGPRVVPLYDGVGFPDQPYQFVAGGGQTNTPPSPAEQTVPESDLSQFGAALQSLEFGPQVRVNFDAQSITLPDGATEVKLTATPEAPTDQPSPGTIAGNVYLISADSTPGPPSVSNQHAQVFLRLPQNVSLKTPPVMIYRTPGGKWKQLDTTQVGSDVYEATFNGWGEYALAINLPQPSSTPKPSSSYQLPLLAGIIIGAIVVLLATIRFRVGKKREHPKS
ncbi:MAG TPA: hypothetical protein VGH44_05485 [Candidatus Saccharimonadia bacterium]